MNKAIPIVYLIMLFFMTSCFKYQSEEADLIVHNAKIYQVDDAFSIAEAMAIKDGKIIAIGPENEIRNKYFSEQMLDARTMSIYPGFIDAHSHFSWYATSLLEVDLKGAKSWEETLQRVVEFSKNKKSSWIKGRGWDQNLWKDQSFPNKKELDSLFPEIPVLLWRIDAHAALANSKALEMAGITAESEVKGGGIQVVNDQTTGMLFDLAIEEISRQMPKVNRKEMINALLKAENNCFKAGLTTVSDAYIQADELELIDSLQKKGILKIKINALLAPTEANKEKYLGNGPILGDKLSIMGFKYFADGALGSRGARLLEEYSDAKGNYGTWLTDSATLKNEAELMYKNGFQMAIHCIGDAANQLVLSIYASVLKGSNDKRWRIEHAQVIEKGDFEKFGRFNIIPSVQPSHATSDRKWAIDRLGPKRLKYAYAYKQLMQENGMIALGTDFPIEDIQALKTFYAAVFRKNSEAHSTQAFQEENALNRKQAIRGMTIWAAIANFEENAKGSLEVGKSADFVILGKDLLNIEVNEILSTKILSTYLNGEKVY